MVIFVFRLFFVKFMETIATICQRMWKLGYYEAALLPMAFVMNSVLMADLMIDVLTDGTVSYTHLDVYKRQVLVTTTPLWRRCISMRILTLWTRYKGDWLKLSQGRLFVMT